MEKQFRAPEPQDGPGGPILFFLTTVARLAVAFFGGVTVSSGPGVSLLLLLLPLTTPRPVNLITEGAMTGNSAMSDGLMCSFPATRLAGLTDLGRR